MAHEVALAVCLPTSNTVPSGASRADNQVPQRLIVVQAADDVGQQRGDGLHLQRGRQRLVPGQARLSW
jgi:hypothetical protein